jgi:hypothetical protein
MCSGNWKNDNNNVDGNNVTPLALQIVPAEVGTGTRTTSFCWLSAIVLWSRFCKTPDGSSYAKF